MNKSLAQMDKSAHQRVRYGANTSSAPMGIMDMKNAFQIFGPFEVEGVKVADKEYQETFWGKRDEECPHGDQRQMAFMCSRFATDQTMSQIM